jgi:hypothetical protein
MSALTIPGVVHTAISLVALAAAVRSFIRYDGITGATPAGCVYLLMTMLTCLTGFFIFSTGAFTKAHGLGLVTLAVMVLAICARAAQPFGSASLAVENVAYSLTFFFHMIPAFTETATRLPVGAPLLADPESPILKALFGAMFVLFLVGAVWQWRRFHAGPRSVPA